MEGMFNVLIVAGGGAIVGAAVGTGVAGIWLPPVLAIPVGLVGGGFVGAMVGMFIAERR